MRGDVVGAGGRRVIAGRWRPRRGIPVAAGVLACVVGLTGCVIDDDTEVAGSVLEREPGTEQPPAQGDEPGGGEVAGFRDDDRGTARAVDEDESDGEDVEVPPTGADDPGTPDTVDGATDGARAPADDRPGDTDTDPDDVDGGDEAVDPRASGEPGPAPQPRQLPAGAGARGVVFGFGPDDTETSSMVLDANRPLLVADAVHDSVADRAVCETRLQAPPDRALTATGQLRVTLVLERRDGSVRRLPRQVVHVDAQVAAGEVLELPASGGYPFQRHELWSVACEAMFEPE